MIVYPSRPSRTAVPRSPETAPVSLHLVPVLDLTDADVGLPHDPVAQMRAEFEIRAASARRLREDDEARRLARAATLGVKQNVPAVHVEVPDDAVSLIDPTDADLSEDERGILRELRRLTAQSEKRRRAA